MIAAPLPHLRSTLLLGILALLLGCEAIDDRVPPQFDVRSSDALLVPFSKGNEWHGESKMGNNLTRAIELVLMAECEGLHSIRDREVVREIRLDLSERVDWLAYGRKVGAQFVIVGEIDEMELSSARRLGMWTGSLSARYQIWDMVTGKRGYSSGVRVQYPDSPVSGDIVIGFEENRDEVEHKLVTLAAQEIGRALCGFTPERGR